MAYVLARNGLGAVLDNRPATATGALGLALAGMLGILLAHAPGPAVDDEGLDELTFTPGLILALGSPEAAAVTAGPSAAPSTEPSDPAVPTESTEAAVPDEDAVAEDSVTEDVLPTTRPPRPVRPPRPPPTGPSSPNPPPRPLPDPGAASRGDPFGSPTGFDELERGGDRWARSVLAALEALDVGTAYAVPIVGNVRFELTICKDGRVSRASYKGGTAGVDDRDRVLLEVGRMRIPPLPAAVAAGMKAPCAKLRHTFSWSTAGAR